MQWVVWPLSSAPIFGQNSFKWIIEYAIQKLICLVVMVPLDKLSLGSLLDFEQKLFHMSIWDSLPRLCFVISMMTLDSSPEGPVLKEVGRTSNSSLRRPVSLRSLFVHTKIALKWSIFEWKMNLQHFLWGLLRSPL